MNTVHVYMNLHTQQKFLRKNVAFLQLTTHQKSHQFSKKPLISYHFQLETDGHTKSSTATSSAKPFSTISSYGV